MGKLSAMKFIYANTRVGSLVGAKNLYESNACVAALADAAAELQAKLRDTEQHLFRAQAELSYLRQQVEEPQQSRSGL